MLKNSFFKAKCYTRKGDQKCVLCLNSGWLTFDVEVLRVALSVTLLVGRDAGVEAGILAPDLLQDERLVADDHAVGHVLDQEFALETIKAWNETNNVATFLYGVNIQKRN